MTDPNQLHKQKVTNQLFNASVVGATVDDFSKNAVLCPVSDLNPIMNISNDIEDNSFINPPPQQATPISSNSINTALFNPLGTLAPQPNEMHIDHPPSGESKNLYRRSTTKKVRYAQIPGLVSSHHQPHEFPSITGNIQSVQPVQNFHQPLQTAHQPSANIQQLPSLSNYFQSIPSDNSTIHTDILIPTSSTPLLPESNTNPSNTFSLSSPVKHLPTKSSALLTPSLPSPLITEFQGTERFDGLRDLSNSSAPFLYSNEIQSTRSDRIMNSQTYRPVYHHWFYKEILEGRTLWNPFSMLDSLALENAFISPDLSPDTTVATNGGRYDVNILRRERYPVYWSDPPSEVRRCSWFNKTDREDKFIPYEENVASLLEEEFRVACETNEWRRTIPLPNGDSVLFQGPDSMVLLPPNNSINSWEGSTQSQPFAGILKRGMDEFNIDEGEPVKIDHLVFVVHGIGPACDLKFRTVQEVVDEFRAIALRLVQYHYRSSCEVNVTNRIEILPICWHGRLHSEDTGIDKNLENITLKSIPRIRNFANTTLLDVLFYTSPIYCQTIITSVSLDINRIYNQFVQRNPSFTGGVSLVGHSLGSIILFDLLCHQECEQETETTSVEGGDDDDDDVLPDLKSVLQSKNYYKKRMSRLLLDTGIGPPKLNYPRLNFRCSALFALGSPIGVYMTVRGLDKLGPDFALPTCSSFFNIFHPHDPVAYRIEPLINAALTNLKPVVIPHHAGRKRMHLELKETMFRMSTIKQKVFDSIKSTWNSILQTKVFGRPDTNESDLDEAVDKVLEEQITTDRIQENDAASTAEDEQMDLNLGILNDNRRIDYVLQEGPLEFFYEYVFAVANHLCYWESEDTVLFILNQIYATMGITADHPSTDGA